jgi:cytochrome c556
MIASRRQAIAICLVAAAALPLLSRGQPPKPGEPLVTIKELMEKTITPATNRLWNVPETPTDEEWATLEEAAITLLAAAQVNSLGGTGPQDEAWAAQPSYQAFNQAMIAAGREALSAVRARKTDALLAAGDVLYPPCEGCHLQFNPGVAGTR